MLANPVKQSIHQFRRCHNCPLLHGHPPPAFHHRLQHFLIVKYHYTKAAVDLDTSILALTPFSLPSYPYVISLMRVQRNMKNHSQQWH
jgi:hypothetical protein